MKKFVAIPYRLQKSFLTEAEREELKKYGEQPMTDEEIEEKLALDAQSEIERAEELRQAAKLAILNKLVDIDSRSIRALREGNATKLSELETQAAILRQQLTEV